GLPASERDRVSRMVYRRPDIDLTTVPTESLPEKLREQVAAWRDPNSFSNRAYAVTDPAEIGCAALEGAASQRPACNGIGTARGLARRSAELIGRVDGARLLTQETLPSATREQTGGKDQLMLIPSRFSAGYMLPTDTNPMTGPNA